MNQSIRSEIATVKLKKDREQSITVCGAGGLSFTVELLRGMDISSAEFDGVSLAYFCQENLPVKIADTSYQDICRESTFFYGLLSTCGLENTGQKSRGEEGECCLHGSLNLFPAEKVKTYAMGSMAVIEGEVKNGFERWNSLKLFRRIIYDDIQIKIRVEDYVINTHNNREQVCLMYHYNFGAPFLSEECEVQMEVESICPKNETAEKMYSQWEKIGRGIEGYPPHVFYCMLKKEKNDFSVASLYNRSLQLKASVSYHTSTLPKMDLWKYLSDKRYVLSFEPCNEFPLGRNEQLKQKRARYIEPYGCIRYLTEFQVERKREDET